MRFAFIAKHRTVWPLSWLCSALGVSRSGFHAWLTRRPGQRALEDERIAPEVRASSLASDRTYGARQVWRDVLAEGVGCGLHKVGRLVRQQALRARPRRRGVPQDEGERAESAVSDGILDRQFAAQRLNQKWIAGFTCIWTAEGWLYVAAVIDLFSRRAVGRSTSATMAARLVAAALAVWRRGKPEALLRHSDQGSRYTSERFQRLMADHGVTCSMSRSGDAWDNAAMESSSSPLETGRAAREVHRARDAARADVFDRIERFHNPKRRHSTIGHLSPMGFERMAGTG